MREATGRATVRDVRYRGFSMRSDVQVRATSIRLRLVLARREPPGQFDFQHPVRIQMDLVDLREPPRVWIVCGRIGRLVSATAGH
uniref:Uncharacterized protein n=2 Tax=unclassified Mycobacterium TaxID=2642494 RepID=A0A5Q5BFJ0_MYCSS